MTLNFLKQAKYFSKACLSALNGPQREEPLNQRDLVYFCWSAFYSCVIYWWKIRDFIVVHFFFKFKQQNVSDLFSTWLRKHILHGFTLGFIFIWMFVCFLRLMIHITL